MFAGAGAWGDGACEDFERGVVGGGVGGSVGGGVGGVFDAHDGGGFAAKGFVDDELAQEVEALVVLRCGGELFGEVFESGEVCDADADLRLRFEDGEVGVGGEGVGDSLDDGGVEIAEVGGGRGGGQFNFESADLKRIAWLEQMVFDGLVIDLDAGAA